MSSKNSLGHIRHLSLSARSVWQGCAPVRGSCSKSPLANKDRGLFLRWSRGRSIVVIVSGSSPAAKPSVRLRNACWRCRTHHNMGERAACHQTRAKHYASLRKQTLFMLLFSWPERCSTRWGIVRLLRPARRLSASDQKNRASALFVCFPIRPLRWTMGSTIGQIRQSTVFF